MSFDYVKICAIMNKVALGTHSQLNLIFFEGEVLTFVSLYFINVGVETCCL